jgi:iron complex transport system substrate-binding protein
LTRRWLVGCFVLASSCAGAELQLAGDDGHPISLAGRPQRIVSLAPHVTELLFAAGLGDRIVGVDNASDYPPAVRRIARIGGTSGYSLEAILSLRPDLVVGWHSGTPPGVVSRLRALGEPVLLTEPRRLEDIPRWLRTLGRLADSPEQAERAAESFTARIRSLASRYSDVRPVRVFHLVWMDPLMTLNHDHISSRVIELCGGVNVFSGLRLLTPAVSLEALSRADPEVILISGLSSETARYELAGRLPGLDALQKGGLVAVNPDLLHRAGPRMAEGAERLCGELDRIRRARGATARPEPRPRD